jgi:hypothetical protein
VQHVSARAGRRCSLAAWVVAAAMLAAGCASPAGSPSAAESQATRVDSQSPREANRPYSYVALGDSWANGAHCGSCETFVGRYADMLNHRLRRRVQLTNLTENGGTSTTMLSELRTNDRVREAVANADIIVIETGLNDLDETGALESVAAGSCGGPDNLNCLAKVGQGWQANFKSIADEIDYLRGGQPTALRLVTSQNIFVSDPSIIHDYGLPKDFPQTGGTFITRQLRDALCTTARQHHGQCVDVGHLFNGPDGDKARDQNTERSHTQVAQALVRTGLKELG